MDNNVKKEIQIRIEKLVYMRHENNVAQIGMREVTGERSFSITIGKAEADSISLFLSKAKMPRPLTHDLLKIIMYRLGGILHKVVLTDVDNGVFFAEMYIIANEEVLVVPARTSDAISMALRCESPIFINEDTLNYLAQVSPNITAKTPDLKKYLEQGKDLSSFDSEILSKNLQEFVQNEEYESAVLIRDELQRRQLQKP